jgi:type IV pilus assembly protein PilM
MGFRLPERKHPRIVGVDIGHQFIKVVELELHKHSVAVTAAGAVPTPQQGVVEGQVVALDQVSGALRNLLQNCGVRASQAVAGVSGLSVYVRQMKLPRMNETNLRRTLPFEARKYINFNPEDTILECAVVPGAQDKSAPPEMDVLLVAAPKLLVESRVTALEAAGLDPVAMDVASLATLRALVPLDGDGTRNLAVADIGGAFTEVIIARKGVHAFQRTIQVGGATITQALCSALNLTPQQAVLAKESLTFDQIVEAKPGSREPASVARQVLDDLVREVRRTLDFYISQFPEGTSEGVIDKMVLAGGTAKLSGLADYFARGLELPTEVGVPYRASVASAGADVQAALERDAPSLVQATGLALWEAEASGLGLAGG